MTSYKTLLLSPLVLASLAHAPLAAANQASTTSSSGQMDKQATEPLATATLDNPTLTTQPESAPLSTPEPNKPTQPLSIHQTASSLVISYPRSASQKDLKIYYAIWSNHNGQDDIKWYPAGISQTEIPLHKLGASGDYSIHAYISINQSSTFLTGKVFAFEQTLPTLSASLGQSGFLELTVGNLPATATEVLLPTWTDANGQDDVKWYSVTPNPDGTASLKIPLKQHNFETGTYHTHFYLKEGAQRRFISSLQTQVQSQHLPTLQEPLISIQQLDTLKGSYRIQVQEQIHGKAIKSIDVATWSSANQGNLKWRTATGKDGLYTTDVHFQEHGSHNGIYHNHLYITYTDGTRLGYATQTVDLTKARLPLSIETNFQTTGHFQVKLGNVYGSETVRYAVWSEEKGQDDLRWYEAQKIADKTYSGEIPLVSHTGNGTYHLHVYQGNGGLGTATFQVAEHQRYGSAPTYPMGECTWGAKILAPWAGEYWGNAQDWAASTRRAGFRTGTTPKVGAIAVWSGANGYGGGYGHVAVVTDVQSTHSIRVKESNYGRRRYIDDFRGWFNPVADGVTTYIYPN